jgi:N-acetylmuramic acid 6-phosphate etherase
MQEAPLSFFSRYFRDLFYSDVYSQFKMNSSEIKAIDFLKIAKDFQLGKLPTESRHPLTMNLSMTTHANTQNAVEVLKEVDIVALKLLYSHHDKIERLKIRVQETLKSKHKIFLCGCGATGRLSLAIETIFRMTYPNQDCPIVSFMAGGDVALIKSLENFEDHPEYGVQQLKDLGFVDGDLLLAITEGGETPFVIGACEEASKTSNKPCFLFCNPINDLLTIDRSRRVIQNENIESFCFYVGPMAISGSTRMQASTALMLAAGYACLYPEASSDEIVKKIDRLLSYYKNLNLSWLADFIDKESGSYQNHEHLIYETDHYFGISILTDTTERSPTFSLAPFENFQDKNHLSSLCYLKLQNSKSAMEAWNLLLGRAPRALNWDFCLDRASLDRLSGFDISQNIDQNRSHLKLMYFKILKTQTGIQFQFRGLEHHLELAEFDFLQSHLILKMILNTLSTLVMGKLNRYQGNVMTWVRPTNNKLIDRSARYVEFLLKDSGINLSYEKIIQELFKQIETLQENEAVVLKTYESLKNS